jgi:hypothetical protein
MCTNGKQERGQNWGREDNQQPPSSGSPSSLAWVVTRDSWLASILSSGLTVHFFNTATRVVLIQHVRSVISLLRTL